MKIIKVNGSLSVMFDAAGAPVGLIEARAYANSRTGAPNASVTVWPLEAKALETAVAENQKAIEARMAAKAAAAPAPAETSDE